MRRGPGLPRVSARRRSLHPHPIHFVKLEERSSRFTAHPTKTMAQITIDIPDHLAQQLAPYHDQFSELFTHFMTTTLLNQPHPTPSSPTPANPSNTYQEILDFLISQPTSEEILSFIAIVTKFRTSEY